MPKKVNEMKMNTKQVRVIIILYKSVAQVGCSLTATFNNENYFNVTYKGKLLFIYSVSNFYVGFKELNSVSCCQ